MTIDELIQRLEEYREELGGDAEVRLMTQENWPFENAIAGVASSEAIREDGEEEFDPAGDDDRVLYICEGRQLGYGSKRAWDLAE